MITGNQKILSPSITIIDSQIYLTAFRSFTTIILNQKLFKSNYELL